MRSLWVKSHFRAVDVFTTPSEFMIEPFVTWGLDRKSIVAIANGQENYAKKGMAVAPRASRNRFGFFGQLVDVKGLSVLLEAVSILRNEGFEDFYVEVNGDNIRFASAERRAEIEAFFDEEAKRPVAERRVRFNGSYQAEQIGDRMSRIDWCVVPSIWWEIFCLVISEAWMFKRPVIVPNVGGPAERVQHDVDGLHFSMGDARALAETMRRACTEEGLWERLSNQIKAPPGRDIMVERFVGLYSGAAVETAAPRELLDL